VCPFKGIEGNHSTLGRGLNFLCPGEETLEESKNAHPKNQGLGFLLASPWEGMGSQTNSWPTFGRG